MKCAAGFTGAHCEFASTSTNTTSSTNTTTAPGASDTIDGNNGTNATDPCADDLAYYATIGSQTPVDYYCDDWTAANLDCTA